MAAPRVVSLLPSATDTVVALGLTALLVGVTHECDSEGIAGIAVCTENKLGDTAALESREVDAISVRVPAAPCA